MKSQFDKEPDFQCVKIDKYVNFALKIGAVRAKEVFKFNGDIWLMMNRLL